MMTVNARCEVEKDTSPSSPGEMHMEDAISISLAAMREIESGLARFGIALSPEEEDKVYVPMVRFIEEKSNGNYRHEH